MFDRVLNTSLYEITKYLIVWDSEILNILRANQWTGFYTVKKELNNYTLPIDHIMFSKRKI